MEHLIAWGEAAIAASYQDMKTLGWIPQDTVVPNRNSECFPSLLSTRLALREGWNTLDTVRNESAIRTYLASNNVK